MQSFTFICSFVCMGHNSKCYGLIWPKYSLLIAYGTQALRVTQTKMQILTLNSFPAHTYAHCFSRHFSGKCRLAGCPIDILTKG